MRNFIGDQIKAENLIARRLSKLTKSIGKILNIDVNNIKFSNENSTTDIINNTIKLARRVHRAVRTKVTNSTVIDDQQNQGHVLGAESRETVMAQPSVDVCLDRKLE